MNEKENRTPTETTEQTNNTPALDEPKKAKKTQEPLDTETTIADMNVEGFRWYNPARKKGKREKLNVSRKEYWAMVRGAFAAMLPFIVSLFAAMGIVFLLAYLWLKP